MDKKQFLKGIEMLERAYNIKFDTKKLCVWYNALKNMTFESYIAKIDELIKTSKYIPNIAEIIDKKGDTGYKQRDYTNYDFNSLYANLD